MKKYRSDLDILHVIALKSQISASTHSHDDTNRFLRNLFDNFYITRAGNKILLSGITNRVPCADSTRNKKLLYPEGFCIKRASIRENYCARSSRVSSRGCVQRGYTQDTIVIRCSDKVKLLLEKSQPRGFINNACAVSRSRIWLG